MPAREYLAADVVHFRMFFECSRDLRDPVRTNRNVIVGERHDGRARLLDPAVSGE